jgi:hypothetical protein
MLVPQGAACTYQNMIFDAQNTATAKGVVGATTGTCLSNVKVMNCPGNGISLTGTANGIEYCEVTNCGGTAQFIISAGFFSRCYAHAGVSGTAGFSFGQGSVAVKCIAEGHTGAAGHGFIAGAGVALIQDCISYNNVGDGIKDTSSNVNTNVFMINNVIAKNTGVGIDNTSGVTIAGGTVVAVSPAFNNYMGSGGQANGTLTTGYSLNTSNNTSSLTADPFTSSGASDYTLNSTANGGPVLKSAGVPSSMPGMTGTGYPDVGVFRHQDPAGGTASGSFVFG